MTREEFEAEIKNFKEIKLKDGRSALSSHNGFRKYICSKKGIIDPVDDKYYRRALNHRI